MKIYCLTELEQVLDEYFPLQNEVEKVKRTLDKNDFNKSISHEGTISKILRNMMLIFCIFNHLTGLLLFFGK